MIRTQEGTAGNYSEGRTATADGTPTVTLSGPAMSSLRDQRDFKVGDVLTINGVSARVVSVDSGRPALTLSGAIPCGFRAFHCVCGSNLQEVWTDLADALALTAFVREGRKKKKRVRIIVSICGTHWRATQGRVDGRSIPRDTVVSVRVVMAIFHWSGSLRGRSPNAFLVRPAARSPRIALLAQVPNASCIRVSPRPNRETLKMSESVCAPNTSGGFGSKNFR